jgi:hypothetical protein
MALKVLPRDTGWMLLARAVLGMTKDGPGLVLVDDQVSVGRELRRVDT